MLEAQIALAQILCFTAPKSATHSKLPQIYLDPGQSYLRQKSHIVYQVRPTYSWVFSLT